MEQAKELDKAFFESPFVSINKPKESYFGFERHQINSQEYLEYKYDNRHEQEQKISNVLYTESYEEKEKISKIQLTSTLGRLALKALQINPPVPRELLVCVTEAEIARETTPIYDDLAAETTPIYDALIAELQTPKK